MGSTQGSEWVQESLNDLADEIKSLGIKHNQLVESVGQIWGLIGRDSSDPAIKQLCARHLEALDFITYEVDPYKPENPMPRTQQSIDEDFSPLDF